MKNHELPAILLSALLVASASFSPNAAEPSTKLPAAATEDGSGFAGAYKPSKKWQPPRDPAALAKLRKFQDLKFGIMYCWGLQTQFGTVDQSWCLCPERYAWNKRPAPYENADTLTFKKAYEDLLKTFNPVKFDPERDARIIADAGAKYLVFCTKHHDGFCFFDTKTTDYKITSKGCPFSTNANADVTRRLFDSFRKRDFWIGVYFSKPDWNTPFYWAAQFGPPKNRSHNYSATEHPEVWAKYQELTAAQIGELTSDYGPVDILWLDGGQVSGRSIGLPEIAKSAREHQPGLLVVDRVNGGGYEDFLTPEGTHAMPNQFSPDAWEACMALGNHSWAWAKDSVYMSSATVIHYLVKATARNGNLLLGVGPDANGEMDAATVKILQEIGAWLQVNGEAIYGTRPVQPYELGNVFFTRKQDGTTYAIALPAKDGEPITSKVRIPADVVQGCKSVTLVGGNGSPLKVSRATDGLAEIVLPEQADAPCTAAWTFRISGQGREY